MLGQFKVIRLHDPSGHSLSSICADFKADELVGFPCHWNFVGHRLEPGVDHTRPGFHIAAVGPGSGDEIAGQLPVGAAAPAVVLPPAWQVSGCPWFPAA